MRSIKVHSIRFGSPPFRKLGNIQIDFAERITIIAGHNGIGKSTVMALVANGSGLAKGSKTKTLFGRGFQANLFDIVHIDYATEFQSKKDAGIELPEPIIRYHVNGSEFAEKSASLTGRTEYKRVRVVPRNVGLKPWSNSDGTVRIGRDAKVGLPTIYLGMTRMFPVGEANPKWVAPFQDTGLEDDERALIGEVVNAVVLGGNADPDKITSISVRGTKKTAKHPTYKHDVRCISLGQDSLGSIATALASFQCLKRAQGQDYPGGLLVIDELDAGLHPHAQRRLIDTLRKHAKRLRLQIIATTHSNHIVEAVHPDGGGDPKSPDSVVYLTDTTAPKLAAHFSLADILSDMSLKDPSKGKKIVKIYFEDDEAAFFFRRIVPTQILKDLGSKIGATIKPIPLGLGGGNLTNLPLHDSYFKKVVLIADADTSVSEKAFSAGCILKLPTRSPSGAGLSPDRAVLQYAIDLATKPQDHAAAVAQLLSLRVTTDVLREHVIKEQQVGSKRESMKAWWGDVSQKVSKWRLIENWANENKAAVDDFLAQLRAQLTKAGSSV